MTDIYLKWINTLKDEIDTLESEVQSLKTLDNRALIIEINTKVKLRYSPFFHFECKEVELKSNFSFKALCSLYEKEIERLKEIYNNSNEDNFMNFDLLKLELAK